MSKFLLSLMCIFISVSVTAETVYKKTNPDGSVEFSDRNLKDSKEIKIRETSTYQAPRLPALNLPSKKSSSKFRYALTINQPTDDETLVGGADVKVSVSVLPVLKSGSSYKVRYELAGHIIVNQRSSVIFKNIDRGTHNLTVSIVDTNGRVVGPVVIRTFHMKRFFKRK